MLVTKVIVDNKLHGMVRTGINSGCEYLNQRTGKFQPADLCDVVDTIGIWEKMKARTPDRVAVVQMNVG